MLNRGSPICIPPCNLPPLPTDAFDCIGNGVGAPTTLEETHNAYIALLDNEEDTIVETPPSYAHRHCLLCVSA